MPISPRTVLLCLLAPATVLGIAWVAPGCPAPEAADEEQRREHLRWRSGRRAIAADLVAGRTTLAAALAADRDLSAPRPAYRTSMRAEEGGGMTEAEAMARNLIRYTVVFAADTDPARAEGTRRRLAAEFADLFPHAGPLRYD